MKYRFYIVDVFSPCSFGGNQLAVLPEAQGISSEGMQKIAREFNFAETTFVLPPSDPSASARVRIFTPAREVDFAGHPTVGTACALHYGEHTSQQNLILEENIGPIHVEVTPAPYASYDRDDSKEDYPLLTAVFVNTAPLECSDHQIAHEDLSEMLTLGQDAIKQVFFASVGLRFCFIQLNDKEAVDRASLNKNIWEKVLKGAWAEAVYIFTGTLKDGGTLYARMFAPAFGIEEDPATGSAAAALVGKAAVMSAQEEGEFALLIHQGVAMGRHSEMLTKATLQDKALVSVSVGGATAMTAQGEMEVAEQWLE